MKTSRKDVEERRQGETYRGLSSAEATELLARHGPNALPEPRPDPWWRRLARQ